MWPQQLARLRYWKDTRTRWPERDSTNCALASRIEPIVSTKHDSVTTSESFGYTVLRQKKSGVAQHIADPSHR